MTVDDPWVLAILQRRCKNQKPSARVFPISSVKYRYWYKKAIVAVLGDEKAMGPAHSARHTGASRDLAEGYRTFAEIQRRGRWKSVESVQRYAKVHAWFEACERQAPSIRDQGRQLLSQRPSRPQNKKHE